MNPAQEKLIPLNDVLNELVDECVAKGMSRRNAIKFVTKIANEKWQAGEFEIYGRKVTTLN